MDTDTITSGCPGAQMLTDNSGSQLKGVNVKSRVLQRKVKMAQIGDQLMIVSWFGDC